jgi:subtilisin family serine protease
VGAGQLQAGRAGTCLIAACAATLALFTTAPPAFADTSSAELIVRFEHGTQAAERIDARRDAGVAFEEALPLAGMQVVSVGPGRSVGEAESRLERDPRIEYAEPNLTRTAAVIPNDTYFTREWGLHNTGQAVLGVSGTIDADIDAPEAWDLTTGNAGVTVAVIDSGVDTTHPDLAPNIWSNPGERGGGKETNGVDDDGDGLIDDVHGWDWVASDANPADPNGHGTHVAGTIGARGNDGLGVSGVAWNTGLMALRVLDASGNGLLSDVIAAYGYAAAHGAAVVNASFGGAGFSQAEYDAIHAAPGTLFVAAAGNDATNNDADADYPCAYDLPNLICVAATDQQDALASFSNYGAATVDLAAPGTRIASDQPGSSFAYMSGTSMATPQVTGSAALVFAHRPGASVGLVRQAILGGADPDPALTGKTVTGARLNARAALDVIDGRMPARSPADSPPPPAATAPSANPPLVSLRVPRGQRLRGVIRRGLRVRVGCTAACRVGVRTLRRSLAGAAVLAGARELTFRAAGTKMVRVHLGRRSKRALRRAKRARLTVVATPFGVEGASVSRKLRLSRR